MYKRVQRNGKNTTDSSANNQFAPRPFKVDESLPQQNLNKTDLIQNKELVTNRDSNSVLSRLLVSTADDAPPLPPPGIQMKLGKSEANESYHPEYQKLPTPPRLQMKLTIGQPGDKYEQEADRVAKDVVQRIHSTDNQVQQEKEQATASTGQGQNFLSRMSIERQPLQPIPEPPRLQMKLSIREPGEEQPTLDQQTITPVQPLIQRVNIGGMAASPDVEAGIQRARRSGQPLSDSIREPMEQAFGADFSGVRVHTDAQADQLNQSIQAKAFTTGQDVFFRQGAYKPGSRGGQELIVHELTHVVQQNGGAVLRLYPLKEEINAHDLANYGNEVKEHLSFLTTTEAIQTKWDLEKFKTAHAEKYQQLVSAVKKPDGALQKSLILSTLSNLSEGAYQVYILLKKLEGDAFLVREFLEKTSNVNWEKDLHEISTELLVLEPNIPILIELQEYLKGKELYDCLRSTTGPEKGQVILDAIHLATSVENLKQLFPLSSNIRTLKALLQIEHQVHVLSSFIGDACNGETLLKLLKTTDIHNARLIMANTKRASIEDLAPQATQAEIKKTINPARLRYTQETCSSGGIGYTISDNIQKLRTNPIVQLPPVGIFTKTPMMNGWGDLTVGEYSGNPNNLEDGEIYTLDNRRLYTYRQAGRPFIPAYAAPYEVVSKERYKFSTKNKGISISVR